MMDLKLLLYSWKIVCNISSKGKIFTCFYVIHYKFNNVKFEYDIKYSLEFFSVFVGIVTNTKILLHVTLFHVINFKNVD